MLDPASQPPVGNIHRNRIRIKQLNEFLVLVSRRGADLDRAEVNRRLNVHRRAGRADVELRHDDHVAAPDAVVQPLYRENVPSSPQIGFLGRYIIDLEGRRTRLMLRRRGGVPLG